jgi:alpha-L-fucosidase
MEGDWYARNLYVQGSGQYNDHLEHFGHPSVKGYKDLIPLWKAEKWDPARLMAKYKKAGAHYFVSMGAHHDNFDLWNSTYHRWNATKMGPMRDVVGTWQKEAKKLGLHFGVSEHLGASFNWFQVSRGSDKTGPLAGVPYDGNDPANAELYHQAAIPGDTGWYTNDPRWHAEWYRRVKDLVDQYHPDLLYSDGGIPFGAVGEQLVAHLYNTSISANHGKQEAVYTCKQPSEGRWAQDVERGVMSSIQEFPWQTDTSIGDWFYNKHWKYRGADWVIHTLVDVVSKNGNLLINVVQRPDGSIDPEAEKVLDDMASWTKVNGESVFDTTPWIVYGEGPQRPKGGAFKEDFGFTARDIRYTQKGDHTVYATLMGSPSSRELVLASFAKGAADLGLVKGVRLLGSSSKLDWKLSADGLHVTLPDTKFSDIAVVLKISGESLRSFHPLAPVPADPPKVVSALPNGNFLLDPGTVQTHEGAIRVETRGGGSDIGYWQDPSDYVSWLVDFPAAGTYQVTSLIATPLTPTSLALGLGNTKLIVQTPTTTSWDTYQEVSFGTIVVLSAGKQELTLKAADPAKWNAVNIREVRLTKS